MKNYRFLTDGEQFCEGDEVRLKNNDGKSWRKLHMSPSYLTSKIRTDGPWEYRRQIPNDGKFQFLMHVSILVPVIVNCDGKSQEEIEVDAGCLAVQKILGNPTQYIHLENIDWDGCRVDDDECQPAQG